MAQDFGSKTHQAFQPPIAILDDLVDVLGSPTRLDFGTGLDVTDNGDGSVTIDASATASPLTTKGDIYGFSTVNARLPIGTDTQVLTADSSEALGVKWATPVTASSSGVSGSVQFSDGAGGFNSDATNIFWDNTAKTLSVSPDTDIISVIGRMRLGGIGDFAMLSHFDRPSAADYAIKQDADGFTQVNSRAGKPLGFSIGNSVKMTMDADGDLGIGTITPSEKLHLSGAAIFSAHESVTPVLGTVEWDGTNFRGYTGSGWINLDQSGSTSPLTTKGDVYGFDTADARIPVGTDGQVLTADSSQGLGLKWATPATGTPSELSDADGDTLIQLEESGDEDKIRFDTLGVERMIIDDQGYVGIGVASPVGTLDIDQKMYMNGTQVLYYPLVTSFVGSYFAGNGGASLSGTGNQGYYNTGVGFNALLAITTGKENTAIGYQAGESITTQEQNTALGFRAYRNGTGHSNTALGYQAMGAGVASGSSNVSIGLSSMLNSTTGASNVAIGTSALGANTTGSTNIAIGTQALALSQARRFNVAIGHETMYFNTGGEENTIIGYRAMKNNVNGSSNTALGYQALSGTTTSNNTAIGHFALFANSSGANNTAVGYNAGNNITTGSRNIIIGYDVDAPVATANDQLNIGNTIYANLSSDFVGIGIADPDEQLELTGRIHLGQTTAPATTTDKLYNVAGTLYWNAIDLTAGTGTVTSVAAGNGLDFTTITTTGSITMGTPGTLTSATSNAVTTTSHTHEITTGIADTNVLRVDSASATSTEYARFTANGLESRSSAESKADLGFITDVVDDTTPQLGGELDCQANSIGFTLQTATGDGTTTIDWKLGNKFKFTFGAFNETFTFTAPSKPCAVQIILVQDSVGSRTATWPATVKWPGGTAPTLTTTATTGTDIVSFFYDGTNYYGTSSANFS